MAMIFIKSKNKPKIWPNILSVSSILIIICLSPIDAATADEIPQFKEKDRFNINIGAFFVRSVKATVRVDKKIGANGPSIGTTLDWRRDLGGENSTIVPRIDGYYRFTPYHRLNFGWYKMDLNGQTQLLNDIDFGDISIPEGFVIDSVLNIETYKLAYNYSFFRVKEIEVALSAGLHTMRIVAGIETINKDLQEKAKFTAPLPVFGFNLTYSVAPKWIAYSKYELFFIDIADSYSGALSDFVLGVNYQPFKDVGFTLAANRFNLDADIDSDDYGGALDYVFTGILFSVNVNY